MHSLISVSYTHLDVYKRQLLFWQKLLKEHLGGYFFWYIVGLSLNVLLVILLLFVMLRPVLIRHLTEKIIVMAQKCGMKIPKEKWLEKLDGFLDGYRGTVLFFRDHKEKILILIVMTFVQRSSAFLLTFLVYLGFGLSGTAMYQILLLQAAIYVAVDMLPVPGAPVSYTHLKECEPVFLVKDETGQTIYEGIPSGYIC